ncbi:uncharacterized protein LOC116340882 [Contarinia nasturtii]|uniref:uncharacterized protein LOC116340882 n=1 Tax=Contarinia nasturtii TaxID=265458 RepID=UPI0012D3AB52|nr:uncharacterized protein LOC116340882 [Contarinia nasturtii]
MVKQLLVCFLVAIAVDFSSACNGYKMRLVKLENCAGPDQVIKFDTKATLSLTKKCDIILTGCGGTTGFKTAKFSYNIIKNGNPLLSGSVDACEELKKDTKGFATILKSFDIPSECPVEKMETCIDETKKMNIDEYKSFLGLMNGDIEVQLNGTHDTGKTCLKYVVHVSRH